MNFSHNTSPLSGKDGARFLTSRHIRERLAHEAMMNVGIKVEEVDGGERFKVSGRGELHLAILIEIMRRESYELEVSPPQVIFKEENGQRLEPIEEVHIEVNTEYQGSVISYANCAWGHSHRRCCGIGFDGWKNGTRESL